jgi:hypothetical protein
MASISAAGVAKRSVRPSRTGTTCGASVRRPASAWVKDMYVKADGSDAQDGGSCDGGAHGAGLDPPAVVSLPADALA